MSQTSSLLQKVRRTIERYALCPPGARVLVGLSGGSDSVALTLLLRDLSTHADFEVVSLAHLNHRLRPSADADAGFCQDLAGRLRLACAVEAVDVAAYAASERLSIEAAARRLRYDFLQRAAQECHATAIAVGHTRDDQAETFLLKLMRGAGLTGLGGVYPRRGAVIRPLLEASREELRAYLVEAGAIWVEDETNADLSNPRNRVRHRVLPEMDLAYGGPTRAAVARAADLVREDGQWLDEVSSARFDALATRVTDGLALDAPALGAEPAPIRRRILLNALRLVCAGREVGLSQVDAGLAVLQRQCRGADVPGGRWELCNGKLVLLRRGAGQSDTL